MALRKNCTFEEIAEDVKEEIYDDVCQQFHYILELPITGDQKQEIISDIVDCVFREWCMRGLRVACGGTN